jgi:hypothetical protein
MLKCQEQMEKAGKRRRPPGSFEFPVVTDTPTLVKVQITFETTHDLGLLKAILSEPVFVVAGQHVAGRGDQHVETDDGGGGQDEAADASDQRPRGHVGH